MANQNNMRVSFILWLTVIVASVAVGLVAYYFAYIGEQSELFREAMMDKAEWLLYLLPAVGLVIITLIRVKLFIGTEGTGIPQTIAALEMKSDADRKKMLSMRILVGKVLLTTLGLFSGASMGREGPTVQVGACIMYCCRKVTTFPQHLVQRGLILAGGAAGIAAAFNAPIAGIVFSIEEIGRSFDKRNLGVILTVVLISCAVCIGLFGDYWFYGNVQTDTASLAAWAMVPVIAICMGVVGGTFSQIIVMVYPRVSKLMMRKPIIVPALIGLAIGLAGWFTGGLSLGTGFVEARNMLMQGTEMEWYYAPIRMFVTALTLLSGIPGGLFDPSLSAGAGFGQWFTNLVHNFEWASSIDPKLVMMIAMATFFAAVVQSPVTAVVIMVEMTDSVHATMPMLVGALIAHQVSKRICKKSIYTALASNYFNDNRGATPR
jgi:H+/Cl- antiporter ClcA